MFGSFAAVVRILRAVVNHDGQSGLRVQILEKALQLIITQGEELGRCNQSHISASILGVLDVHQNIVDAGAYAACHDESVRSLSAGCRGDFLSLFSRNVFYLAGIAQDEEALHACFYTSVYQSPVGFLIKAAILIPCGKYSRCYSF